MSWEDAEDGDFVVPDVSAPAEESTASAADDSEWCPTAAEPEAPRAPRIIEITDTRPLILVNFTALSDGKIHNRDDAHACNDAVAKSQLSKKIEKSYALYEANAALIAAGFIRPCGASVWREALTSLRAEQPGQYWCPVWP
eukprot:CAMPEP_0184207296 /NCGR_PEP_ID=MMETSP0976-20121227/11025_1 /TAXON_ID=483370 /ORGANISM="non described non described, Strain CCMP2097" /LENGTH=140 /DNA_ID=CAMNT_0026511933 /DNA_START=33 /DNA_END=452 /DNA_ORIENTATION=-